MFKGLFQKPVYSMPSKVKMDTSGLDMSNIPEHIAIIMDGNGRWAKEQGKVRTFGHKAGAETLKKIVKAADALGIKAITAYAFSTENWKRPVTEVHFIMELLSRYLTSEIQEFKENNVQVRFMGSREGLPAIVNEKMDHAIEETKNDTGIILNLAINYGGQAEILHAVRSIARQVADGTLKIEDIDVPVFENNLYSKGLPSPDLMIRTGGDLRVSNFLLWQIAYAEIWTTSVYWPDFTPDMLIEAIKIYQKRERRFGGLVQK
ncbi:MAG: isoprenyl transferase [Acidaminococcaceae bacterium]|uniref:isoprenyl transferase n=1 Tax=Succiniclasticum sp. TaxID=2775030 RepID=UPI000E86FA59|nr:isoprenyl transferase [Succiniclasticum sp.]MBO5637851.1 isoprenyl transferase [Acidaminococcaceae bacterium]MBP3812498.1 isoprenyl transferase [Acidaminococcaceae bacterium]MBR1493913.1 isoprenyl transferase [Acidaminococcaceae bacterium]MBR1661324.1 isoprenyl transferase [Acidaminococcaceae bacterium]MDY6290577.1 isoprenyl transferase [Succiniclasticum sp.]